MAPPSIALQKTVAYVPKVFAVLSLIGSGYIFYDCLRKLRRGKGFSTYHRLMIGISVGDVMYSTSFLAGTWVMPRDTPNAWGASGTTASCTAFGVLTQGGVTGILYNASLAVYFLLRIKHNWPATRILQAEKYMHMIPIGFGIISQSVSLALDLYNSNGFVCYVAAIPRGCLESWKNGVTTCVRGDNSTLYRFAFTLGPKVVTVFFVAPVMFIIYLAMRQQEQRTWQFSMRELPNSRLGSRRGPQRKCRLSHRLAVQCYFYVGALYLTYMPALMARLTEVLTDSKPYWVVVMLGVSLPIQGFWNLLVYLRPRYLHARNKHQEQRQGTLEIAHRSHNRLSIVEAVSYAIQGGDLDEEIDATDDSEVLPSVAPIEPEDPPEAVRTASAVSNCDGNED